MFPSYVSSSMFKIATHFTLIYFDFQKMDLHTITAKYTNVFLKRPSTISSLLTVRFVISNAFLWFPTVWTMGFWSVVNLSLLWRFLLVAVYMVPPPPGPCPEDVSRDGAFFFPCDPSKGELPLPSVLVSVHKKTL